MGWTDETWRRLGSLMRRSARDAELDEEMRFHLEMRAEEHRASGMDATQAAHAARRRFGSVALLAEEAREAAGWPFLESVWRDVRLGLRSLRRSPAFVVVALVSLSLGMGANAAVFSFIDALFLSPIPGVADSSSLFAVQYFTRDGSGNYDSTAYPAFDELRATNHTFTDLAAYTGSQVTARVGDRAEALQVELVSGTYFTTLGVKPVVGRAFLPSEGRIPGADPIAVASYDFWQRLGGDAQVLGRSIQVGSAMFTIVGVAPPGFRGVSLEGDPPSLWLPASMSDAAEPGLGDIIRQWGNHSFDIIGRIRPGASLLTAAGELTALASRTSAEHPQAGPIFKSEGKYRVVLVPAARSRISPFAQPEVAGFLQLLGIAGALVFLIACFNVAGLVLARAMRRQNELALQLSLGAGRARLIRQLLVENLLLSVFGTAAGLLVARWTTSGLGSAVRMLRATLAVEPNVDGPVLVFAGIVAAICALILTALPARVAARASLTAVMTGGTGKGGSRGRAYAQQVLVVVQVALSVALLVGASLFVKTLQNARATDPTVRPQDLLVGEMNLKTAHYDDTRGSLFYGQLLERLRALSGVRDAALVYVVPLGNRRGGTTIRLMGDDARQGSIQVGFNVVSPSYFATIGLPMVAGRNFTDADRNGALPVAVISEFMAHQLFAGRRAIGEHLLLEIPRHERIVEVIGVVRDGRFRNYRAKMEPTVYVPIAQNYQPAMNLEVRAAGSAAAILPAIEKEMLAIDKNVPLTRVRTLKAHLDEALARERLTASLLSGLGLLALVLAAVGLYGILSYMVAQRTRELGIRAALGARPSRIIRMVVRHLIVLVALGLVTGTSGALVLMRLPLVRDRLFGVEPTDPLSLVTAVAALLCTATLAAWLPARRAAKADPAAVLRYE